MQKKFLSAICLLVCSLTAVAQTAEKTTAYITETSLHCGEASLNVETYCEPDERLDAACFLQRLKFKQSKTGKEATKLYLYENYKQDMSLVTELSCVKGRDKNKIVLSSTNLGNCETCEWEDYFSTDGVFLGSNREKFGPSNIKIKALPADFFQKNGFVLDDKGHFGEVDKVQVKRTARKEK